MNIVVLVTETPGSRAGLDWALAQSVHLDAPCPVVAVKN